MAISDINKAMALYAQPTEFDQNAWKIAFDISNAFTNANNNRTVADENARKHRENLNTELWRTASQNADFRANAAEKENAYTQQTALADSWQMLKKAIQENGGRIPTAEELFNIGIANPNINPALFTKLADDYQRWSAHQARTLATINPQMASTYNILGGNSPFEIDKNGSLINFNSGQTIADKLTSEQLNELFTPLLPQDVETKIYAEAEKARQVREARQPYILEEMEVRNANALAKQQSWQDYQQVQRDWKDVKTELDNAVSGLSIKEDLSGFGKNIQHLMQVYPHLTPQITAYVQLKQQQFNQLPEK